MFFFFNDPATTEIYTLPLHDALPIWPPPEQATGACCRLPRAPALGWQVARHGQCRPPLTAARTAMQRHLPQDRAEGDRKSTRLNSSHANISYAVFCLKKKKKKYTHNI